MKIEAIKTNTFPEGERCKVRYKYRGIDNELSVFPSQIYGKSPKRNLRRRIRCDASKIRKRQKKAKVALKTIKRKEQAKDYLEMLVEKNERNGNEKRY